MIPVQTKEHLIYFMQRGVLRLSKYDLRFIQNLENIILLNAALTTNQVILFDKLVEKYRRQLYKHGLTADQLSDLKWESNIIPSDPKFTEAYISIIDDKILFKGPYNKKFVVSFKSNHNPFKWVKEGNVYEADYSTYALKMLLRYASEHYPIINYCSVTSDLLNSVEHINAKYWEPTLIEVNGNHLIAAINKHVAEAIKNIPLSTNVECLAYLARCAIKVDEKITKDNDLLKFASEYLVEVDFKDVDTIVKHLTAINCDAVVIVGHGSMLLQYRKILTEKVKEAGIHYDSRSNVIMESRIETYNTPVLINLSSTFLEYLPSKFVKVIRMKNSLPVVVK